MAIKQVFGMPPRYPSVFDRNNRVYKKLWGQIDSNGNLNETNLYSINFKIGSPKRVRMGLMSALVNKISNADSNTITQEYEKLKVEWDTKVNSGMNTFNFGSALHGGTNSYIDVCNHLIEMLGYGAKQSGVPDSKNPYFDSNLRLFSSSNIQFPTMTVLGSEETSITESVSNEVGDSKLKGMLDKSSEMMREFSFINAGRGSIQKELREVSSSMDNKVLSAGLNLLADGTDAITSMASKMVGSDIVNIIAEGNQVVMPQVWKTSSFSKKYSISFRLSSPYGDHYSIAKNINIPLAYILGASIPLQKSPNTISFPFLVQVDRPGAIAINMGMITNIVIKKGGKDDIWSNNSMYRSLDITLDVVDLFEVLPAPINNRLAALNIETRDFMSNLAGGSILTNDSDRYSLISKTQRLNSQLTSSAYDEFAVQTYNSKYGIRGAANDLKELAKTIKRTTGIDTSVISDNIELGQGLETPVGKVKGAVAGLGGSFTKVKGGF